MKSLNCRVFCFTWFQSVNFNHLLKYEDSLAEIRTIEVDFFYFDLSRGGKVEKDTGADLGFIIVIDLPDYQITRLPVHRKEKVHNSFSMDFKAICDGDPLSIFLLSTIIYHKGSITTSIIMSL